MTIADKISVMEAIWEDLSQTDSAYTPPDWHGAILKERQQAVAEGTASFTDWETAKKEIKDSVS